MKYTSPTCIIPIEIDVFDYEIRLLANIGNQPLHIYLDGPKSQLIYAKPILDKYGFKASFFIICGRVGTESSSMNWQDIAELKKDGMDIESHSMTHTDLNNLLIKALEYEIGGSKQCFANHGYNTT